MKSASRLLRASLLLPVLALAGSCMPGGRTDPANVVVIVIDTLRADHLGCEGYERPTSPNLDRLAASGTRFASARSSSSWTLPAVASILTGLYPAVHGAEMAESVLSADLDTMAAAFRADGYETVALSANPAFVTPRQGMAKGFERFDVLHGAKAEKQTLGAAPASAALNRWVVEAKADDVTAAALQWLGARAQTRPFLLYVHYFDPHAAYAPPAEFLQRFGVRADDPLLGEAQWPILLSPDAPSAAAMETLTKLYDAEIAATDAAVGRLLEALPEELRKTTIVAVTSDHGEEFGEHGGVQHGRTLFDELLRVPLLVAGPGVPRAHVVETPVSLTGLWATLAELAGAGAPADGATEPSFAGLLRSEAKAAAAVYADLEARFASDRLQHRRALVEGSFKLLLDPHDGSTLFDLSADSAERRDLAADHAEVRDAMQTRLGQRDAMAAGRRQTSPPHRIVIDPARREALKALGYLQ